MLFGNLINDSFCLLTKQLRFYSWHYKRDLDPRRRQELIDILEESHFEKLANKIKSLHNSITDSRQQIGKILIERCYTGHRRHQLKQLISSELVDINVRLDNYGRTLLHRTAYNLDVELVRLLIEHNVDLRLRDYAGNTALHIAIQSYRNGALMFNNEPDVVRNLTEIIKLLLDADRLNSCQIDEGSFRQDENCKRVKLLDQTTTATTVVDGNNERIGLSLLEDSSQSQMMPVQCVPPGQSVGQVGSFNANRRNAITPKEATICRLFGSQNSCKNHCNYKLVENDQMNALKLRSTSSSSSSESINYKCGPASNEPKLDPPAKVLKPQQQQQQQHINPFQSKPSGGRSTSPLLDEHISANCSLIASKNAFGRTVLHYCVLVVGEKYMDHFVKLLLSYNADPNAIDIRLKTPLYCLVKRPGFEAVRQKCRAIEHLLESGCDDLGLALEPKRQFSDQSLGRLEANIGKILQQACKLDNHAEPIFTSNSFKRPPSLKHLCRLELIRQNADSSGKSRRQVGFSLPKLAPRTLNDYINRRILDQAELF